MIVSRSISVVSLVAALAVATTEPAAAASANRGTSGANAATPPFVVVVQPSSGQPGDYFNAAAKPGTTVHAGTLVLRNTGRSTVRALLVPVDALTASNLGSTYKVLGTPRHGPTLWTHLSQPKLTLAPHATATVAVSVSVPAGTQPGDYLSGVSIQARKPRVSTRRLRSNVEIASIVRYAVGVEIRIPGPRHPAITLNRVTLQRQPRGLAFLIDATNSGNVILKNVTGTVEVTQGGRRVVRTPIGPGTFVTATSIQLAALSLQQQVAQGAVFHVHANIAYVGGSAKLDRDLTFGSREAQLQQEFGGRKVPSSGAGGVAAIAAATGSALLLAGLIALALLLRRRRRARTLPAALAALERALADPRRAGAPVSVITAFSGESESAWRADTQSVIRQRLRPTDTLAAADDGALVIIAADTGALAAAGLAEDLRGALARELPAVAATLTVGTATADASAVAGELLAYARADRQPVAR